MTTARFHYLVAVVVAVLSIWVGACVKNYYPPNPVAPSAPSTPTPTPPVVVRHTIEFRALGTTRAASLQYGSAQEGSTDISTIVPWSSSFTTTRSTLFVFITGRPDEFGFELRVQIFIDGELFREAATDGLGAAASASGTVQLSATTAGAWREMP
jgi:hypothetical protein